MNWTGELYGFYTEKPIQEVFEILKNKASEMPYKFDYNKTDTEETLLFYKDQEMLEYHLENGYNTDLNGEGCFSVEAKTVKLDGIATLFEFEGLSDFEPYDINLVFSRISYYVLVVPDFIEESQFSKKIHTMFRQVLSGVKPG
ncbi:hypothetical protein [Chitinophaga sp.]|jgi:hypothetical protein|uniref:hypothetical protein n=1 Tax=Chitinophaga sp. TaxID=1869181 RepID=UPI002BA2811C|nr:hypothetical protein [Chitinophaga sp.]HWV67719.1 hypothetical protein [Chitinophaga sp.]